MQSVKTHKQKGFTMTDCSEQLPLFPGFKSRKIQVDFKGGDISSDAGGLLLRQADRNLGLTKELSKRLTDTRRIKSCDHKHIELLRQRIYGVALGYEDLNDHDTLRKDVAFQTFVDRDEVLAHPSTLCRLENRANDVAAWVINSLMVDQFIESQEEPPEELILDFDATDDPVHGQQENRMFHGYYDKYCFLPLYVFCGSQLLVAYLRPSRIDAAKHSWAILSLLVKRFREKWPDVKIIFRGDSGFCRWKMFRWCDSHDVGYIVGLGKNKRINRFAAPYIEEAREQFGKTSKKQRLFGSVKYAADTWDRERRVIVKAEHNSMGSNPRYVVTNLEDDEQHLYDNVYCARGDMENRIKEQQLDLFSDRTSCHKWWSNQFRLLLSSLAYILVEYIRRVGLKGTELAKAQCGTIRLKLFKLGSAIIRNTRNIYFHASTAYPYQDLFLSVARRLARE
jgi:hypothetical protein